MLACVGGAETLCLGMGRHVSVQPQLQAKHQPAARQKQERLHNDFAVEYRTEHIICSTTLRSTFTR